MLRSISVLLLSVLSAATYAQTITLDEAIAQGLRNRPELKAQEVQIRIAEGEKDKLRAQWLPQLSASADLRWNTELQTSVLPIGQFGLPGVPSDATQEIQIGVPFNNALGVQAEQKIYDANRRIDRQINAAQVESRQIALSQETRDIRFAITEAYYAAVFNREKRELARQALDRAQLNLRTAENQLQAGAALPNDVDRLALDVSNAQLSLKKVEQDYALSVKRLQYQMGAAPDGSLQLSENVAVLLADTVLLVNRIEQRPEILSENIALRLNALNREKQLARRLPTVSAYGNYTLLQLSETFNPVAADTWFPYSFIGVKASVPIFDGRQASLSAREFALRQDVNRYNLDRLRANFNFEATAQASAMEQARLDVQESLKNVALARQLLSTDQLRFEQGVLKQTDLKNSEFALQTAENNYLNAVYAYLVARLNYEKSL
ncbi:MAG: TolC family protein [Saprospiraceae bacterium]|nr:TolC family protein [Saprospiraceae bacterium]